jgi:hypothetical protein
VPDSDYRVALRDDSLRKRGGKCRKDRDDGAPRECGTCKIHLALLILERVGRRSFISLTTQQNGRQRALQQMLKYRIAVLGYNQKLTGSNGLSAR